MRDADDEHEDLIVQDRIHNHVILAGVNAAKLGIPFQLTRRLAIRIVGEQSQPPRNAFSNVFGKFFKLSWALDASLST